MIHISQQLLDKEVQMTAPAQHEGKIGYIRAVFLSGEDELCFVIELKIKATESVIIHAFTPAFRIIYR